MSRNIFAILLAFLAAEVGAGGASGAPREERAGQFRSALQWHDVSRCVILVDEAALEYPDSPKAPGMELELGRSLASVQSGLVGRTLAMERLSAFLPGGKYATAPEAEEGRYWLARAQVLRGRLPQAQEILIGLLESHSPKILYLASKDLVALSSILNDPVLAGACRAPLKRIAQSSDSQDKESLAQCAELSRRLRLAGDQDSRDGALARALLAQDAVLLCADAGRADETKSRWADLDKSLADALDWKSDSRENSTSGTALLESQAQFAQAMSRFRAGDYARCRSIASALDESSRRSRTPELVALGANARLWIIACDIVMGREPKEVSKGLQESLEHGGCGPGEISWIVRQMADQAQVRGAPEERYLLLRDLVESLPSDPDKTVVAAREAREIEERQPQLIAELKDRRSSIYGLLESHRRQDSPGKENTVKEMTRPTPQ